LREHLATDSLDLVDPAVIEKAQQLNCLLVSLNGDFADIVKYLPRTIAGSSVSKFETTGKFCLRLWRDSQRTSTPTLR